MFRLVQVFEDGDGDINNMNACCGCGTAPVEKTATPMIAQDEDGNDVDITLMTLTDDPVKLERISEFQEALSR